MTDHTASQHLHIEYWGECLTCRFWKGARISAAQPPALCGCADSPLANQLTHSWGYCPKWDSFDIDVAFEVMQADEDGTIRTLPGFSSRGDLDSPTP